MPRFGVVHNVESVAGLSGMKATILRGFNGGVFCETDLVNGQPLNCWGFLYLDLPFVCNMCAEIHPENLP